jgi:hypothetical protein
MLRYRPLRGINTIGRTLKKTPKRYPGQQGVIPPETNSALVAAMEDVLAAPGRASTIRIVACLPGRVVQANHRSASIRKHINSYESFVIQEK